MTSCNNSNQRKEKVVEGAIIKFDVQGHRGARGLAPENSIPGFWKALSLDVTTLEMDLAITKDRQVILSHEPWFSHLYCKDSTGQKILEEEARSFNIYEMTYDEILKFDCGSIRHPSFPEQELLPIAKPRLRDVIQSIEQYIVQKKGFEVDYNIEIKSSVESDNIYHPEIKEYSDLVYGLIDEMLSWKRVTIQSFDFRVLQYFNQNYPDVRLAALIENENGHVVNIKELGFTPDIYSCYYKLLEETTISALHEMKMQVIPWTVNETTDMEQLYDWGVDGFITDYPNRVWNSKIAKSDVFERN